MIIIKIPLKKYIDVNGMDKTIGQTIVNDTTYQEDVFDHIDVLSFCRTKNDKIISTVHQAYVIVKVFNEKDLITLIKRYQPNNIWFK